MLGFAVVGVVVAGGEGEGAEHYAAGYFGAEAAAAGLFHGGPDVGGVLVGVAVFYAVVAGEVGGAFGGGDDVVAGEGVFGGGEGYLAGGCAEVLEGLDGLFYGLADLGVGALGEVFGGDA